MQLRASGYRGTTTPSRARQKPRALGTPGIGISGHRQDLRHPETCPACSGMWKDLAFPSKLLVIFTILLIAVPAIPSTRPHYGSTARVLIQHKVSSLDPLVESDYPAARDKLAQFLFETLTEIDSQGRLRPRLASSWLAEAGQRVWQFQLRPANFQDGTAVTAATVVASVKSANPDWKITAINKQAFSIETPAPSPHLPELLSLPRFAIVKRATDTTLVGTGPYKLSQWQPGEHALFTANDDYWGGRPYPDAIDVQLGASLREHLLERSLGHDHAAELGFDQVHALEQTSQNVLLSRPAELLVLLFLQPDNRARASKKAVDPHIREAIAGAINRGAISNVLLQKRGTPATAMLPQWLSGYEFMFADKYNPEQARKLRTEAGTVGPVSLAYDFADPVSKMVAERIAVDAREAGITIQPFGDPHVNTRAARRASTADAVLLRLPLRALDPCAALTGIAEELDVSQEMLTAILSAGRPDELFNAERKVLEDFHVVPVAHLSHAVWLNSTVHNWQQLPNGEWRLDQMWIEK